MSIPKITIQNVGEETITLNVNGEIQNIQNQLTELKSLLQSLEVQNVQYADKIYNIEHINEANFGFVTGKRAFNESLTKELIETIRPFCIPANKFYARVQGITDWQQQTRISDKAKEIIAYSFVGVIGIQLSKLMAIGKEAFSDEKQRKYIHKSITIIKRTFDLVNFALLSKLWDIQKEQPLKITTQHKNTLAQFFDRNFEQSIEEQFALLESLHHLYIENQLDIPLPELQFENSKATLANICKDIEQLNKVLDRGEYSLIDCFEAETKLAAFFQYFAFLVNYDMASIKRIGYKQMRHVDPRYLHRFAALGIDSKANVNAEKVIYTPDTVHTDAVLLYKGGNYQNNINLFPLVIDYNALTFESGVAIYFYQGKDIADGSLEYRFLETEEKIQIEKKGIIQDGMDYNQLMLKEENQIAINLDQVIAAFEEARRTVLNDEIFLDDL